MRKRRWRKPLRLCDGWSARSSSVPKCRARFVNECCWGRSGRSDELHRRDPHATLSRVERVASSLIQWQKCLGDLACKRVRQWDGRKHTAPCSLIRRTNSKRNDHVDLGEIAGASSPSLNSALPEAIARRTICELTTQRQGLRTGKKEGDEAFSFAAAFGRCGCVTSRRQRGGPGTKCIEKWTRQKVSSDGQKPALEPRSFEFPGRRPEITSRLGERPMNSALERQGSGPQQSERDRHRPGPATEGGRGTRGEVGRWLMHIAHAQPGPSVAGSRTASRGTQLVLEGASHTALGSVSRMGISGEWDNRETTSPANVVIGI